MFDRPADGIMKAPVIGARRDLPVHSGGQGIYQHAADGRRFIDAASGAMVSNLGHGNAEVVRAVTEQLAKGPFAYRLHFRSEAVEAYAEALAARCPDGLDRCYFVSGGSEAIEAALKLARQAAIIRGERDRWKVISRYPGYHGTTFGALSATGYDPLTDPFEPFLARMPRVPVPVTWRDRAGRSDAEIAQAAAAALDAAIIREGAGTVLAFLMEPVGGASTGALVSPDAYFPAVREVCDRHGVLLIHDEVMCGAGRTGAFLAGDHWGCRPDFLVLSKGIGAGYVPLGAVVARGDLVDAVERGGGFAHGHTHANNPLAIANAARQGERLLDGLARLGTRYPFIGDTRGKGLLTAVEFVADRETATPFHPSWRVAERVVEAAFAREMILYERRSRGGRIGDHVLICPPLIVTAGEVDMILDRLDDALAAVSADLDAAGAGA
jgi:adenosylmethionine-8-amino-7-oxononanoate aminotransferase